MRILIDLQGAQSESRFRGIGRYSLALALGVARNAGEHEIWIALNGALPAIDDLRRAFAGLVPQQRIRVFDIPAPVAEIDAANGARCRAAELVREHFLDRLRPDAILVTSLFEGYIDDAVVSVGSFAGAARTAVVLYDLIPFLNPDAYLGTPEQRHHYAGKIASLKKAGLLLAISDYSRQEAIGALELADDRVVAISTAVDASFAPGPADAGALHQRLGVVRATVMYAPGGFDTRKNIDGLIAAYAMLPADLRARHQLVIASKLGEHERRVMTDHARQHGLAPDELVLTGYVSDADLITLYRTTALFVFPSKHEGFGLPALEAMACGALVIGADNTSIPEVIGCTEALFDAASPASIAARIGEVLTDPALQARLREHGRSQAAKFSWDVTASRALRAIEASLPRAETEDAAPPPKRRLAFVSPLPPAKSGIADYAAQLLPALMRHVDIELVVDQDKVRLPDALDALPRRTVDWFREHAGEYDQILYQFGNSPFHSHMFTLLQQHPGVVVLHDFFLGDVLAYEQTSGAVPGAWTDALYYSHGYAALAAASSAQGIEPAKKAFPCNLEVLEAATSLVVHSQHALDLAGSWYGAGAAEKWRVAPLPRARPARHDRAAARRALGLRDEAFVVCSFGFIAPTKLSLELVRSWIASPLLHDRDCELILVGANHGGDYGVELSDMIRAAGAGKRIRIAGWTSDEVYRQYLQAADVGVQLRSDSRGETSAAVLDCMNYGLATIVNANGSMRSLPDDAVWKLPEDFTVDALAGALVALRRDARRRTELGARAADLVHTEHSPENCARRYVEILDEAWCDARTDRRALLAKLAAIPGIGGDEHTLQRLAHCLAAIPDPLRPRQLLFDVTAIAQSDLKTGIERVVRNQLMALLRKPIAGLRVEPVVLSQAGGQWHYRYASRFALAMLGIEGRGADDAAADIGPGDLLYSADYSPATVREAAQAGVYAHLRERGVEVSFLVYDLLPVLRPEFFPANADQVHAAWLDTIARNADTLLCISEAVRTELEAWMDAQPNLARRPVTAALHLGADLDPAGASDGVLALPPQLRAAPTFLMVGTIEPRKGHLQAIAAFERLWAEGVQANLAIVGGEGWKPLARGERRTIPRIVETIERHPELGKRLFWLKGVDDETLSEAYQASICLLAPSEGEGFGLPLIEAARYELPVIARALPVFREVAGRHAFYFDGLEAADLAGAVQAWLALHSAGAHPGSAGMAWRTWQENTAELLALIAPAMPR